MVKGPLAPQNAENQFCKQTSVRSDKGAGCQLTVDKAIGKTALFVDAQQCFTGCLTRIGGAIGFWDAPDNHESSLINLNLLKKRIGTIIVTMS
jgi:hypothetical protein